MSRLHREYSMVFIGVQVFSLFIIFIAASYFQVAHISQLISFQAWDGPGPMPIDVFPRPLGIHFFGDFSLTFRTAAITSPYLAEGYMGFAYLPFSALILSPLFFFSQWVAFVLFVLTGTSLLIGSAWFLLSPLQVTDRVTLIFTAVLASSPFVSTIDRGNVSLILTGICLTALLRYSKGGMYSSALLFGLAAAMKLYPILFLILFVRRQHLRALAVGIMSFLGATLLPLFFFSGGAIQNGRELVSQYVASSNEVHASNIRGYNNSFFALFDSLADLNIAFLGPISEILVGNYLIFLVVIGFIYIGVSLMKADEWQSLMLSTTVIAGAPTVSGNYVFLLFLLPLFSILRSSVSISSLNWARVSVWMIAFLFVPKNYPFINPLGFWSPKSITYTSVLNPLITLVLFIGTCICVVTNHLRHKN